jgi:hypothetical protein
MLCFMSVDFSEILTGSVLSASLTHRSKGQLITHQPKPQSPCLEAHMQYIPCPNTAGKKILLSQALCPAVGWFPQENPSCIYSEA